MNINKNNLIRISELAKAAAVSVSTIHYYVQEGLITPPTKTSRNMAYYDPCSIQEIRLIQELQTKRFLPLSVIKLIIQAKRNGQNMAHITEMQSIFEDIFRPLENEEKSEKRTLPEIATAAELPESSIKALEEKGLIVPIMTDRGPIYDDIDLCIAQTFKKLLGFGLKPDDFDIFRQHLKMIRTEVRALHETFHKLPDHERIPLKELFKTVNDFRGYLTMRIIRQEAEHFHEHNNQQEK